MDSQEYIKSNVETGLVYRALGAYYDWVEIAKTGAGYTTTASDDVSEDFDTFNEAWADFTMQVEYTGEDAYEEA